MSPERMYELADELGLAKNCQDISAALTFMHEDIELNSPAWGAIARGKQENAALLKHFFTNYPDYSISFEGYVTDRENFVGWGMVRMTMAVEASDAKGMSPTGQGNRILNLPNGLK